MQATVPDRPYFSTIVVLIGLIVLSVMFLMSALATVTVPAGSCFTSGSGIVIDEAGRVIDEGTSNTECSGVDWPAAALLGSLTLLSGAGVVFSVGALHTLGRRWNSPIYFPAIWTVGTGAFVALLLWIFVSADPYTAQMTTCSDSGCTTSNDLRLWPAIVWAVLLAAVAVPFAFSARNLWRALHPATTQN